MSNFDEIDAALKRIQRNLEVGAVFHATITIASIILILVVVITTIWRS